MPRSLLTWEKRGTERDTWFPSLLNCVVASNSRRVILMHSWRFNSQKEWRVDPHMVTKAHWTINPEYCKERLGKQLQSERQMPVLRCGTGHFLRSSHQAERCRDIRRHHHKWLSISRSLISNPDPPLGSFAILHTSPSFVVSLPRFLLIYQFRDAISPVAARRICHHGSRNPETTRRSGRSQIYFLITSWCSIAYTFSADHPLSYRSDVFEDSHC